MNENKETELVSLEEQIGKPLRRIALAIFLLVTAIIGVTIGFVTAQLMR